ncbi:MAG TPA: DUF1801 domain-containing protein [Gemmatimonadaceae bacterium]|nr:DUF1801 domain-containing protein [Gemmatimonadaceae bacterium]
MPAKEYAVTTVEEYLASLPDDRRREIERVRRVVRKNLPAGYVEGVGFGMICYSVPLSVYRDTYNKQPLMYAALASQKNHLSLYLMPVYPDNALEKRLRNGFAAAGKKLDMGKSCIRFKHADDLELDAIGDIVAAVPVERWIEIARSVRRK